MTDATGVTDHQAESRFEFRGDGYLAELDYHLLGKRLILIHTEVPAELGGRGIGGLLVSAAIDRAAQEGLAIIPLCPFAQDWLERHPADAAGATIEWDDGGGILG